ncbi:MAG TPA: TolC family protein [Candidatus Krumholzibacteria bacterium]|nr:TolC family protein [Candidatus Krumholzibacteria bacterium]
MTFRRAIVAQMLILCALVPGARAEQYDLERCLELALEASTNVGVSREQLRSARSDVLRSYGGLMPSLSLNMWAGHSWAGPTTGIVIDDQGRPIQPSGFDYEQYSFSISSQMNVFNWGANYNTINQSKRSADAAAYELEYTRDFVRAVTIREYYELVRQNKLEEVQVANLEAKRRNLEQIEAFYKIGSRTKADYLQARVDYSNSELLLMNVRNAKAIADARLKSRLNIPQDAPLEVDESIDFSASPVDLNAEVDYMFEHRSDLLASRYRIDAARAGLSVTEKQRYPTIDASFNYGWNDRTFPGGGEVFKNNYSWSIGAFLNWNLFDRFQTKSGIQNARAQHRIAEYNLQQAKIDAVLDVKQIVLNIEQATERLDLAEETVAAAEENLRLAEERYRVGAGTILETIEASSSLTSAQASLIDARVDYLVNRADLQRATGRSVTMP